MSIIPDVVQTTPTIERFLEHCHRRQYPAKSLIIYAGDKPDVLYYIVDGSVSVLIEDETGREIVLAYLNPGDFFGEIALLEDHMRTATVHASQACTLIRITRRDMLELAERYPEIAERLEAARLERRRRDQQGTG